MYIVSLRWYDKAEAFFLVCAPNKGEAKKKAIEYSHTQEWPGIVASSTIINVRDVVGGGENEKHVYHIATR